MKSEPKPPQMKSEPKLYSMNLLYVEQVYVEQVYVEQVYIMFRASLIIDF